MGRPLSRKQIELSEEDVRRIADVYHAWRGGSGATGYQDEVAFCVAASVADIEAQDFSLSPGRYVGAPVEEEDDIAFEERMSQLVEGLDTDLAESARLTKAVKRALGAVGYDL